MCSQSLINSKMSLTLRARMTHIFTQVQTKRPQHKPVRNVLITVHRTNQITYSVNQHVQNSAITKINVNEPILNVVFVSISSLHLGHTILMGYSPKKMVFSCLDSSSLVETLDDDCIVSCCSDCRSPVVAMAFDGDCTASCFSYCKTLVVILDGD